MQQRVLFVDDDPNTLLAIKRVFHHDPEISVLTASCALEAMQIIKEDNVPVIISDHDMPNMTGIEFLEWAKASTPDSIRILLTGRGDFGVAIDSINRCEVYRFIPKPWKAKDLKTTIRDALQRYGLVACLKSGDEAKLLTLVRTIELKDPYTRGHSERVAGYALQIADALGMSGKEKSDIRFGSLLHDCGKIGVPEAILSKAGRLTVDERETINKHARWSGEIAEMAGLHSRIVSIARHHHERYDGRGYPAGLSGLNIPKEARIVALADVYDALASDRPYRRGLPHSQIMEFIQKQKGVSFDPALADLFITEIEQTWSSCNENPDS
jgi:putative two-component system response regulator